MDFSNWKCHASSMGLLMTDPKGKSNRERYDESIEEFDKTQAELSLMNAAGKSHLKTYKSKIDRRDKLQAEINRLGPIKDEIELSETAKAHLVECYVKAKYGRTKEVETDAMIKGTKMEEEGITVLSRNHKLMYKKNKKVLENEFIIGTPDIIGWEGGEVALIDTKLSWDQFTFEKNRISEIDPKYYWQLQSYSSLMDTIGLNAHIGKIAYVLVNTPEFLIEKAIKRMQYNVPESEWIDAEAQIRKNMTFDDVHIRERLIEQQCRRNDTDIERMKQRVVKARVFLQKLDSLASSKVLSTELK